MGEGDEKIAHLTIQGDRGEKKGGAWGGVCLREEFPKFPHPSKGMGLLTFYKESEGNSVPARIQPKRLGWLDR